MLAPLIMFGMFALFGIFLINGKGYSLIAGFNSKSDEELKDYDVVAVCKFVGKIMFGVAFSMVLWLLGEFYNLSWLITVSIVVFFVVMVFYIVYTHKWKRFRK